MYHSRSAQSLTASCSFGSAKSKVLVNYQARISTLAHSKLHIQPKVWPFLLLIYIDIGTYTKNKIDDWSCSFYCLCHCVLSDINLHLLLKEKETPLNLAKAITWSDKKNFLNLMSHFFLFQFASVLLFCIIPMTIKRIILRHPSHIKDKEGKMAQILQLSDEMMIFLI